MIGIMSAMQEEIQALINQLENVSTYTKGKRKFYIGNLFGKEVVLVFSRWGKVAAATTATQLINDFNLNQIIFTGVAGAISKDLVIGDIVIGKKLVQHDMNTIPLFKPFEIPILKKTFFEADNIISQSLYNASQQFIQNYKGIITEKESNGLGLHVPKVIFGDIASGVQFVNTQVQVDYLSKNLNSVVCVEMEGAAVAQVCYEYDIPYSIIRTISDNANDDSITDFALFINKVASKYALEIFKNYFKA